MESVLLLIRQWSRLILSGARPPGVQLRRGVLRVSSDVVAPVAKAHIGGSNSEVDLELE